MPAGDIQVANRVTGSTRALAEAIVDPGVRAQQGGAALAASMTREANVLAYNDVFRLVWRLALGTALLIVVLMLISATRPERRSEPA